MGQVKRVYKSMTNDKFKLGELTQAVKDIAKNIDEIKSMLISYEDRITSLENWRWYILGMTAVIAFVFTILADKIYAILR